MIRHGFLLVERGAQVCRACCVWLLRNGSMKKEKQTVLAVDDDPEWLDFLSRTIGTEYHVLSASDGEDAVCMARREVPDVIILDVIMAGGKDGFTVFAELRNNPITSKIPVIMFTDANLKSGLSFDSGVMKRQLGKAPAAFLEKSVSPKRLLSAIKKALRVL